MPPPPEPDEAVRVIVQARPLLRGEASSAAGPVLSLAPPHAVQLARAAASGVSGGLGDGGVGGVDVFGPYDDVCEPGDGAAERLYREYVAGLVESLFDGVNASVMAYGQTASGKTYTMSGMSGMAAEHVFRLAGERSGERNVTVRVGFVEIYQEAIMDLVDSLPNPAGGGGGRSTAERGAGSGRRGGASSGVNIAVRTRRNGTVFLDGAREVAVRNAHQLEQIVAAGGRLRQTAATGMNSASSRSHSIVTITVQQEPFDDAGSSAKGGFLSAKLHLVDLAGSERTKRCTASGGTRFAEGVHINGGLLALAKVISALADGASHVPYRESNLTRLLQDSLGGNSRSLVVACVSPSALSREETASTLRYAMRIKNIRNRPRVNVDPASVENSDLRAALARARLEMATLKKEVTALRKAAPAAARAYDAALARARAEGETNSGSPPHQRVSSPSTLVGKVDVREPIPRLRLPAPTEEQQQPVESHSDGGRLRNTRSDPQYKSISPEKCSRAPLRRARLHRQDAASSASTASPAKPPQHTHAKGSAGGSAVGRRAGILATVAPSSRSPAAARSNSDPNSSGVRTPPRSNTPAESSGTAPLPLSPEMEPGSLMVRLAELEELLQTPTRSRGERSSSRRQSIATDTSSEGSSSVGGDVSIVPQDIDVAAETAAARRGLPSLVEDFAVEIGSGGGKKPARTQRGNRVEESRVTYERKVAALEQARAASEQHAKDLSEKLSSIENAHMADLKTRDAEHQACIAELRTSLADMQKKYADGLGRGGVGDSARWEVDRQRLIRRLKTAERAAEEATSKLNDALGRSGQSQSELLRENRSLTKQENTLRVRVKRLEAIRARQAEQIQDYSAREKLVAIERHQNRLRSTPIKSRTLASASTNASTMTTHQRQQWLERELTAMSSQKSASDGLRGDKARHWAWVRSMDDAKMLLRMCLGQLAEARTPPAGLAGAAEGQTFNEPAAGTDALHKGGESGNARRPSQTKESCKKRRSSNGCGAPEALGRQSLRRSSSTTLLS